MYALAVLACALVSAIGVAGGRPLLVSQHIYNNYNTSAPFNATYHGGRVLTNQISNYLIWYGT